MEPIGFNDDWTADVVGQMHKYRISNVQLAAACGYTPAYLSTVLNRNDDLGTGTKKRIIDSLDWRIEVAKQLNEHPVDETEFVQKLAERHDRKPEVFLAVLDGSHKKILEDYEERTQIKDWILEALTNEERTNATDSTKGGSI